MTETDNLRTHSEGRGRMAAIGCTIFFILCLCCGGSLIFTTLGGAGDILGTSVGEWSD